MAKPIKRNRAVSHKKKKVTAVAIKKEIADKKRCAKPVSPVATKKKKTNDDSGVGNRLALLSSPKKKSDLLYIVGKAKVNLSFRKELDNYTLMLPQISKEISSNFNYKYKRRATVDRRSNRNASNTTINSIGAIDALRNMAIDSLRDMMLVDHSRCYVEDYMMSEIGDTLLILVPQIYEDKDIAPWSDIFRSELRRVAYSFTKHSFIGFNANVVTNPSLNKVTSGMHISDYMCGFGNHNYGCHLSFDSEISFLLPWKVVLDGTVGGIQVWRRSNEYRNVFPNYANRIKTARGIQALTNRLFGEVYGDRIQALHILDCHNRATVTMQNRQIKEYNIKILSLKQVTFDGDDYNTLLRTCDESFEEAIKLCYTDFVVIGGPIVSRDRIQKLVNLYKSIMPHHYNAFYKMLGFDKKVGKTQNVMVAKSGYYDRLVFYNFLAMARQRNNKVMVSWAMISAGANYGRGIGEMVNRRATFLGASSTTRTFLRKVMPYGQSMESNITKTLSFVNKTVWALDNNQSGNPVKHQRWGSSNNFVKVTGRTCRECIECTTDIGDEREKRVMISYVDQAVVNPIGFSIFEKDVTDMGNLLSVKDSLLRRNKYNGTAAKIDITGLRISTYIKLIRIANTISKTLSPLLTGYIKSKDKYKVWNCQPNEFQTEERNMISKILHSESDDLKCYAHFQSSVVNEWNPKASNATAFIIPPVSLRDEIKTDGYGMAMIELLCLSGILIKVIVDGDGDGDTACSTSNW